MSWLPKNCVVVPVDFSPPSLAALATARELVDDAAQLHVIHVLTPMEANEPGVVWDTVSDASRCEHAEGALREQLTDPGTQGAGLSVVVGDPGERITEHAKQLGADLIVLPSHGRTGLSRILIGSVAERVVRLAHCPVLVIRQ